MIDGWDSWHLSSVSFCFNKSTRQTLIEQNNFLQTAFNILLFLPSIYDKIIRNSLIIVEKLLGFAENPRTVNERSHNIRFVWPESLNTKGRRVGIVWQDECQFVRVDRSEKFFFFRKTEVAHRELHFSIVLLAFEDRSINYQRVADRKCSDKDQLSIELSRSSKRKRTKRTNRKWLNNDLSRMFERKENRRIDRTRSAPLAKDNCGSEISLWVRFEKYFFRKSTDESVGWNRRRFVRESRKTFLEEKLRRNEKKRRKFFLFLREIWIRSAFEHRPIFPMKHSICSVLNDRFTIDSTMKEVFPRNSFSKTLRHWSLVCGLKFDEQNKSKLNNSMK